MSALDELLAKQLLVADGAPLRPAAAGRELIAAASAETAPITARIWGGIPTEDLAAAGRVLALVTERANAELAALTARPPDHLIEPIEDRPGHRRAAGEVAEQEGGRPASRPSSRGRSLDIAAPVVAGQGGERASLALGHSGRHGL